jgi:hypothetical protein
VSLEIKDWNYSFIACCHRGSQITSIKQVGSVFLKDYVIGCQWMSSCVIELKDCKCCRFKGDLVVIGCTLGAAWGEKEFVWLVEGLSGKVIG